jgi:hypothetical protein
MFQSQAHRHPRLGNSNLNVAVSLGRSMHDRGVDATAGTTEVDACNGKAEAECFALKRPGGSLDGKLKVAGQSCDLGWVLTLVGGNSSQPSGRDHVMLGGMAIHNRLAPNVSEERRQGLTTLFGGQFRLLDIVDKNSEARRETELPASTGSGSASSRSRRPDARPNALQQPEIAQFAA